VSRALRVLVVEDDPVLADAHVELVGRVDGFVVDGAAHSGAEALRFLAARPVDLVLLDVYLPDMTGLDVVKILRGRGLAVDVIAVTSARDLEVVRAAVSQGVVQYLLKPFTFATLRDKLAQYADYHRRVTAADADAVLAQQDVDRVLAALRAPGGGRAPLPKGLSEDTMAAVVGVLRAAEGELSASQVADDVGVSRVTARRYLEHLAEQRLAVRSPRYGGAGRPEFLYGWATG
jgi:response regulator of citrate/malate metabolism